MPRSVSESPSVRATSVRRSSTPDGASRKHACQYCHRRKLKCDLALPRCNNCVHAKQDCRSAERTVRPRPTHRQIDDLQKEVRRLRAFIHRLQSLDDAQCREALHAWTADSHLEPIADSPTGVGRSSPVHDVGPATIGEGDGPNSQRRTTYANTESEQLPLAPPLSPKPFIRNSIYSGNRGITPHNPTSAFFEDSDAAQLDAIEASGQEALSENVLRDKATAECAVQRHWEVVNLAAGKLDFDGLPADLSMHLLSLHWNRQHFAFMVSYRPLFMRDMACAGPYFSKLLLNAIFYSVSKFSERAEVYDDPSNQSTAGLRFLRRVKELLGEALDKSSIPTIQAMLLLSSSLFAHGQISASWLYTGIAVRMILDLGLNYDTRLTNGGTESLSAGEIEIRRRVVWAAFVYDKILSLYQGRAVSFSEDQIHVPIRFLDQYEELELWMPFAFGGGGGYSGSPARAISTFSGLCSLAVIMSRVVTAIYADRKVDHPEESLKRLAASLDRWKTNLPECVAFDPVKNAAKVPPPHVLSLHLLYHTVVILLHRPFVEAGHHHRSNDAQVANCWSKCEASASASTAILGCYRSVFTLTRAPYLISYTVYVAATINARIVAQRGPYCEAAGMLDLNLQALQENAATNPGVRQMHSVILALMNRLNVVLHPPSDAVDILNFNEEVDMSAIIRSFGIDPLPDNAHAMFPLADATDQLQALQDQDDTAAGPQPDNLFGLLNSWYFNQ